MMTTTFFLVKLTVVNNVLNRSQNTKRQPPPPHCHHHHHHPRGADSKNFEFKFRSWILLACVRAHIERDLSRCWLLLVERTHARAFSLNSNFFIFLIFLQKNLIKSNSSYTSKLSVKFYSIKIISAFGGSGLIVKIWKFKLKKKKSELYLKCVFTSG